MRRRCCCGNCERCRRVTEQWEIRIEDLGGWWDLPPCIGMAGTFLLDWLRQATYLAQDICIWRYEFPSPVGNYPQGDQQLIHGLSLGLIAKQELMVWFDGGDVEDGVPTILPCWLLRDSELPSPCTCPDDHFLGHLGEGFVGGTGSDSPYWSGEWSEAGFRGTGCYEQFSCIAMRHARDDLPTHAVYLTPIPVT